MPGRTKAYGVDLRWRMVWQRLVNNYTIKKVAANLYIAEATVWRIVDRFQQIGDICASLATPREHRLSEHDEFVLIEWVCEKPSIHLHEIQLQLLQTTGTNSSADTLCRTLGRLGMTTKKLKYVALQRSDILRAEYQPEVSLFDHSMLMVVMPEMLSESMDTPFVVSLLGVLDLSQEEKGSQQLEY